MEKVILGRTGLEVTKLALGGLFLSELGGAFEDSKHATLKALELGINYIDTAPAYYDIEKVLGKILQEWEGPLVISTKLGGRPQPFDPQSKKALIQSVEMSLEYLHRDSIDILMIHEPDRVREYNWWTDELNYEGPVLEAIDEMKKAGMIKFSGLGGTTAHELARVCDSGKFDVVLTAYNYSLLWREAQYEIFQAAKRHHMGVVCGSPAPAGRFGRPLRRRDQPRRAVDQRTPARTVSGALPPFGRDGHGDCGDGDSVRDLQSPAWTASSPVPVMRPSLWKTILRWRRDLCPRISFRNWTKSMRWCPSVRHWSTLRCA